MFDTVLQLLSSGVSPNCSLFYLQLSKKQEIFEISFGYVIA